MNKDDFDLLRQLKRDHSDNAALELIKGLQDRRYGFIQKNVHSRESIELFAEEQFVRKKDFDEMRCEMPGMPRSTFLMVFSPDGSKVASTHGNHNIYITDLRNGKNIKTLIGHPRTPWCIAFHPTSDQIVASGCLGGQVRIWDLSGGSEVWTAVNQTVIASLAFHPNDRVLAIATYNGVYFWDWSQPEPFVHAATYNVKEKVRYVAFDSLGHKLITGIANSPMTRWERVRAPVPVARQERCASPYRRRITQRLVNNNNNNSNGGTANQISHPLMSDVITPIGNRGMFAYPERERRITMCYRTLVREYEHLVQRYLQLYRPPTMIDRGTDPMEPNPWFNTSGTQTSEPQPGTSSSTSPPGTSENLVDADRDQPGPSRGPVVAPGGSEGVAESVPTSSSSNSPSKSAHNLLTPSRIFSVIRKPNVLIRGTQTTAESRKHKVEDCDEPKEKRMRKDDDNGGSGDAGGSGETATAASEEAPTPRCSVVIDVEKMRSTSDSNVVAAPTSDSPSTSGFRVRSNEESNVVVDPQSNSLPSTSSNSETVLPTSSRSSNVDELLSNIRRTAEEEVRNRILPIIRSVPVNDRPELIRLFENSREHVRMRFKQILRKPNRRLPVDTTSDSSSSEEDSSPNNRQTRRNSEPSSPPPPPAQSRSVVGSLLGGITGSSSSSNPNISTASSSSNNVTVRDFNTKLEQLVTSLLTEIERDETDNTEMSRNSNVNTQTTPAVEDTQAEATSSALAPRSSFTRLPKPTVSCPQRTATPRVMAERTPPPPSAPPTTSSDTSPLSGSLLFQEFIQVFQNRRQEAERARDSPFEPPATVANTNTRTTNSTVYTSSGGSVGAAAAAAAAAAAPANRRRFFSHRISAFTPARVNYTRHSNRSRRSSHHSWSRSRLGSRGYATNTTFGLDELINYSELENSEDDPPPPPPPPPDADHPADPTQLSDAVIGDMYSNIVQDLESSLDNVVRMRASSRPGEASNMLSNFSERLQSILTQSDAILRNLANSMEMLSSTTPSRRYASSEGSDPPPPTTLSYFDPNFYVRDQQRNDHTLSSEVANLETIFSPRPPYSAIAADHTYPRNPENAHLPPAAAAGGGAAAAVVVVDSNSPMLATIHLTILHIQRQARLLRQQVESIEQIDRAMLEVEQLQLIRQLVIELVRHVRTLGGAESGGGNSSNVRAGGGGGMSSVRQMMAGTRISDSSPYDSPAEEGGNAAGDVGSSSAAAAAAAAASTTGTSPAEGLASSSGATTSGSSGGPPVVAARTHRSSNRKTYPPSRMFRLARQCRRPSVWHFFSRRYTNRSERNVRQSSQARSSARTTLGHEQSPSSRYQSLSYYSVIDGGRLSLMIRRLEQLLTEQMRVFTSPEPLPPPPNNRSAATIDLGEHILALRLHGCVLRMNRVLGHGPGTAASSTGELRADPTAAVTHDGVHRYGARHLLSLIIDSMSRHVEELGATGNIQHSTRSQINAVLGMSVMLTELLMLVVADSIPPPAGVDYNPERASLTSRIDQLCGQMLQNRQCTYSHQLTRSLRLMKLTMRHAHSALGQTYHTRRNAMLPRQFTDRRFLLGSINRCLRTINRRRQSSVVVDNSQETSEQELPIDSASSAAASIPGSEWYATVSDLISQYGDHDNQPSTSSAAAAAAAGAGGSGEATLRPPPNDISSNNDNSDDDDDDEDDPTTTTEGYHNAPGGLYRTSNMNLAPSAAAAGGSNTVWNVPSVQINDVPITESSPPPPPPPVPTTTSFAQRLISQRQRFAERVSELRSNPQMGLFRPRFLHPLYASVNPFDADLDDPQREQIYDSDMITTVTPNHRIQAWDVSDWNVPNIGSPTRNVVVGECKIHNDASVDVAKDGTILVTLLPSGGYLNVTNRLGVYSLKWETLGQCLYTTSFEQNAVSVSLSPLSRHLVVGLASRIVPSDRWVMARVFRIDQKDEPGDRLPVVRELEQNRDSRINCIRWLPSSGQGLVYATNTGQLVILT